MQMQQARINCAVKGLAVEIEVDAKTLQGTPREHIVVEASKLLQKGQEMAALVNEHASISAALTQPVTEKSDESHPGADGSAPTDPIKEVRP